jgi:hypothetical protein
VIGGDESIVYQDVRTVAATDPRGPAIDCMARKHVLVPVYDFNEG